MQIQFPSYHVSLGEACAIVKYHLDDKNIALQSRILAIEAVAGMETINGITKDELQHALKWLYDHFELHYWE
mgnify:FL=1